MSRDFRNVSPRDPCPICQKPHGCKVKLDGAVLCLRTESQQYVPSGYRFVKLMRDGMGGLIVLDASYQETAEAKAERERLRWQREVRQAKTLPIEQRDIEYRKLAAQLELSPKHRQALRDRGLTDIEIDLAVSKGWVRTWEPGRQVDGINPDLPGIDPLTGELIGSSGFIIAALDVQGRIAGYQLAADDRSRGKYKWLSSAWKGGSAPNLPNGDLPLFVWQLSGEDFLQLHDQLKHLLPEPINSKEKARRRKWQKQVQAEAIAPVEDVWLPEGALKSMLVAFRHWCNGKRSIAVVGSSGATYSQKSLQSALRAIAPKRVQVLPDAGDVLNQHVIKLKQSLIAQLLAWQFKTEVGWWGQETKDDADIDELTSWRSIRWLTKDQFKEQIRRAQYKEEIRQEQERLNSLSYAGKIVNERYLTEAIAQREPGIYLVKSPMGSGKTEAIKRWIAQCAQWDEGVILIGSRNSLLRQTCERAGITHIHDLRLDTGSMIPAMIADEKNLALCADSLWRLRPEECETKTLVIDEAESVTEHLVAGETCKKRRAALEMQLEAICQAAKRIILMDAHLSNLSVEYFRRLAPDKPVSAIVNNYKTDAGWEVKFYRGSKDSTGLKRNDRSPIDVRILEAMELGEKIIIVSDSQCYCETLEKQIKENYPEARGLRVDRSTVEEEIQQGFLKNPNEWIRLAEPDYLIFSPTAESGIDIYQEWFDEMYGVFFGVVPHYTAMQMLGRYRVPVPRRIFAYDLPRAEDGKRSPLPKAVKKHLLEYNWENVKAIALNRCLRASEDPDDAAILGALTKLLNPETGQFDDPHLEAWARIQARRNHSLFKLRNNLEEALIAAGHQVYRVVGTPDGIMREEMEETQREVWTERAETICKAEQITPSQAKRIRDRFDSATPAERAAAERSFIQESVPGMELTPEFVIKIKFEERNYLKQARLFWMFYHLPVQAHLDRKTWLHKLYKESCRCEDIKGYYLPVKVASELGFEKFLDPNFEYHQDAPEVKALMRKARSKKYRQLVNLAFNLTVTEKTCPIAFIDRVLKRMGLQLSCKQDGIRYYRIDENCWNDPTRAEVLAACDRKYADLVETYQEQQEKSPGIAPELAIPFELAKPKKSEKSAAEPTPAEAENLSENCEEFGANLAQNFGVENQPQPLALPDFEEATELTIYISQTRSAVASENEGGAGGFWQDEAELAGSYLDPMEAEQIPEVKPLDEQLVTQIVEVLQNPSLSALEASVKDETEHIAETYLPLRCEEEEPQQALEAVGEIAQLFSLSAIAVFAAKASKEIVGKVLSAANKFLQASIPTAAAAAGAIAMASPSMAAPPMPPPSAEVLALAEQIRQAQRWMDIEFAVMENPDLKAAAWSLLSDEDKARIKALKPRPLLYVGDRVRIADRASPYFGQIGKVEKLIGCQQDALVKFGDGSEAAFSTADLEDEWKNSG